MANPDYSTDPDVRVFKIPSNKVWFRKNPRYGSWSVNFDKGQLPSILKGQFLRFEELYELTEFYLQNREKWKCSIGEELTGRDIDDAS